MRAFLFAQKVNMEVKNIFVTDLSKELGHLSRIDGLAAMPASMGVTDMYGSPIDVAAEDLPLYIANTERVLNTTKDSNGEIVGLPIDLRDHDHQGGAGWLIGLELDEAEKVIRFLINWTEAGVAAIGANISRYFSPTFDQDAKIILGGSLTNWPGSRDQKGKFLLRPVELSKSMQYAKEIEMTVPEVTVPESKTLLEALQTLPARIIEAMTPAPKEPKDKNVTELSSATITELLNTPEAIAEMGRKAEALAADKSRAALRTKHVVEFASTICGGTQERPVGFTNVKPEEVVELLLSLPERQSLAVEAMLDKFMTSALDFRELGTGGSFTRKQQLPAELKAALRVWVDAGKPANQWFTTVMPNLKADDYNLSEFIQEDK